MGKTLPEKELSDDEYEDDKMSLVDDNKDIDSCPDLIEIYDSETDQNDFLFSYLSSM